MGNDCLKQGEFAEGGAEKSFEERIKDKFKNLSGAQLITRANRLPDFKWDDEGVELKKMKRESNGTFDYVMRGD